MLAKDLLGGNEPLTLTVQPRGLGNAKIGDQQIYPWGSWSLYDPPVVIDYSAIDDLSGMIEIYMDGKATEYNYVVENINVIFTA